MNLFDTSTTYSTDYELFDRLGLERFEIKGKDKTFIGEHTNEMGTVKIWVECWPAQFYTFEIYSEDNQKTVTISTGSGALSNFWDFAENIRQGMIAIDKI